LVLTEKREGGEWIAIKRLLKAFKKTYPSISYRYLTLEKRRDSSKRISFIRNIVRYFFYARLAIKTSISNKKFEFILASDYLWALAAISVKPRNTKLIFLFHGLRSIPFRKLSDVDYRQILIKALERFSWTLSDAIVVPSKVALDYVWKKIKCLIAKHKIFLVPNIVPITFFVSGRGKRKTGSYNILYSGRLGKYKGLESLIFAFSDLVSKIPQANLLIAYPVSSIDPAVESVIKRLVKEHGLERKVKFVKDSTENELVELYGRSDVLVLPSEIEFAPLCVLESFASGTPVVGTDVGNVGSLLQKLDSGLILNNNSPEEIVRKLMMFYKYDSATKSHLRKKAIHLVGDFSEEKASKEFKKVLSFLQDSSPR